MSKRNVAILGIVLLLALSSVAFALMPSAPTTNAPEGDSSLPASIQMHKLGNFSYDPACPPPGPPSCG